MDDVVVEDVCTRTTLRRMAALLDQSTPEGTVMPRGWHVALFAPDPPQSRLRPDGFAGVGVPLPESDLTRLMFGGRRTEFMGDIPVGVPVLRYSRLVSVVPKTGRSGRMLIATVRHVVRANGAEVLTEEQDFVLLEPGRPAPPPAVTGGPAPGGIPFTVTETMLLRFSALMFNTHRIHYDHPYATAVEGYPALVVNGSLTTLLLTELFRARAGRQPRSLVTRNLRPLYCGRANTLHVQSGEPPASGGGGTWTLWAADESGAPALEARIR